MENSIGSFTQMHLRRKLGYYPVSMLAMTSISRNSTFLWAQGMDTVLPLYQKDMAITYIIALIGMITLAIQTSRMRSPTKPMLAQVLKRKECEYRLR